MGATCDYHPTTPAHWECGKCETAFCNRCVEKRLIEQYGNTKTFYFCPNCDVEVEKLAFEDTVMPFWHRLPRFFLYPFQLRPLALILALSLLSYLFLGGGLISGVMQFILSAIVLKYSFAALTRTAQGHIKTAPKIDVDTISNQFQIVFKQIALFFILGILVTYVVARFGPIPGLVFALFLLLSLPSIIIILVASNSLINALNPMVFVSMAWRIGWSYLIMCLFLIMLLGAPMTLWHQFFNYLPHQIHPFLLFFAKSYYTMIAYTLMGYVLYQYHEEIGYEVEREDEEWEDLEDAGKQDPQAALLNRVNMLIKDGRMDDAIQLIKSETRGNITNPELADRYYNLLKIKQDLREMVRFGKAYTDLLSKDNRNKELLEVYSDLNKEAGFTPSPAVAFRVARSFNEAGEPMEAVRAYDRFIKNSTGDPLIPKAYYLAANIINEKMKNPEKAMKILKNIIKKYPGHEIIPHVEKYLMQMQH
ncbi:MAG: tetratricopeptide repeat protein [Desulfatiglandales bacterium]